MSDNTFSYGGAVGGFVRTPEEGKWYRVDYHARGSKNAEGLIKVTEVRLLDSFAYDVQFVRQDGTTGLHTTNSGGNKAWWRIYWPVDEEEPKPKAAKNVYLDCSASVLGTPDVRDEMYEMALAEGQNLYGFSSGGCWEINTYDDMSRGNGGTMWRDVTNHLRTHPAERVVIITDDHSWRPFVDEFANFVDNLRITMILPKVGRFGVELTHETFYPFKTETPMEESEMKSNARIYEYRVHNDEKVLASGEVIVAADDTNPADTARDLAVVDFVKTNPDVAITDVTVVVRPFSTR